MAVDKIKILMLQTHYLSKGERGTHSVDFARVINPGKYLAQLPEFDVSIRHDPFEGYPEKDWTEIAKNWDIIYSSYLDSAQGYVEMIVNAQKNDCVYAVDIDDNLWEIPEESPSYKVFYPRSLALHVVSKCLEDSEFITTTNQFLKEKVMLFCKKRADQITVLPNYIDLDLYDYRKVKEKENKDEIVIAYYGTNTHIVDIMMSPFLVGLDKLLQENKNVVFKTIGFWLPRLTTRWGPQYRHQVGEPIFEKWVDLWGEMMGEADIVVAPLLQTDFSQCKSNIKFLEYSAAKKPGVYEDIRQYREMTQDGPLTGYLAKTGRDWYNALKKLVEDPAHRKEVGENAYNYVKDKHTIQGNITQYADYFKHLYGKRATYTNLKRAGFVLPG